MLAVLKLIDYLNICLLKLKINAILIPKKIIVVYAFFTFN